MDSKEQLAINTIRLLAADTVQKAKSGHPGAPMGMAGALLARHPVRLHPLPADRAVTDLDTPEAWAAWRARNP